MVLADYLPLVVGVFLLGVTPGPVVAATVATAARRGVGACAGLIAGVAVADIILVGLVLAGLAAAAEAAGEGFWLLRLAAAGYLVWLGIGLWRKPAPGAAALAEAAPARPRRGRALLAGTLINLSNPKAVGFYAAFLPALIDIPALSPAAAVMVVAICAGVPTLTNLAFALAAARAGRLLKSPRAGRRLNQAAGTALVGAGVAVAVR